MKMPDTPFLSLLRERMTWLHQRQDLLAQNVANADTPRYVARDLKAQDFSDALKKATSQTNSMTITNVRHIALSNTRTGQFEDLESPDIEASPTGNSVSLETQMIKVSDTQAQFAAAANLYAKAMTMMKTAIGR